MTREEVLVLVNRILAKQGKSPIVAENQSLAAAGFGSLDFSELALRVEAALGRELPFDAARLRGVKTIDDVLRFFAEHDSQSAP